MDAKETDRVIKQAKLWIQQNRPPHKKSVDEVLAASKSRLNRLQDFIEENDGLPWPEAPRGMYLNKKQIPMQKSFYSKK